MAGSYSGWTARVDAHAASSWIKTKQFKAALKSLQDINFALNTDREGGLGIIIQLVSEPVFGRHLRFPEDDFFVCVDDIQVELVLQQIKIALEYKLRRSRKDAGVIDAGHMQDYNYGAAHVAYRKGLSSLNMKFMGGVISYDRDHLERQMAPVKVLQ